MKNFKLSKLLLLFSLIIVLQNGTVVMPNPLVDPSSCPGEETIDPCSDLPNQDDVYN